MPKTVTLQSLGLADIVNLSLDRDTTGRWRLREIATLHDATGGVYRQSTFTILLPAAASTTLDTLLSSVVLPLHNAQEGV